MNTAMECNPAAERIAVVVADLRAGRVQPPPAVARRREGRAIAARLLTHAQRPQPVVDCTGIFTGISRNKSVDLYDDFPEIVPPWPDSLLGFVTKSGTCVVMQVHSTPWSGATPWRDEWPTDNTVDWGRVRWIAKTSIWAGGGRVRWKDGDTGATVIGAGEMPTTGPCHLFRHAIYDDGSPADISWVALMATKGVDGTLEEIDENADTWNAALTVLQTSLNFLNCSNVDTAEPARPRAQRRRLDRTGVTVQTVVVRPPGKRSSRSIGPAEARPMDSLDTPVGPVRGHHARYGPKYDRGLLFGKYAGKFWITGHVRGARSTNTTNEPVKDYVLKPAKTGAPDAD